MSKADTAFRVYLWEVGEVNIPNWPEDEYGDSLDTENLVVIGMSESGVEFCCGGDWQEPQRLLLTPDRKVVRMTGPTNFGEIEIDTESLAGLEEWLEEANSD